MADFAKLVDSRISNYYHCSIEMRSILTRANYPKLLKKKSDLDGIVGSDMDRPPLHQSSTTTYIYY